MSDRERAEVEELEEELRHLFLEHRALGHTEAGTQTPPPGRLWAQRVAPPGPPARKPRAGQTFEAVLEQIDSALKQMADGRLTDALAALGYEAASIIKGDPKVTANAPPANAADFEARLRRVEQDLKLHLQATHSLIVPISTFTPEPYEVLRPLFAVVTQSEEQFIASFFDANVHASGDTQEEALTHLKSLVLDTFDSLARESPDTLGPESQRQLAVLREFISRGA